MQATEPGPGSKPRGVSMATDFTAQPFLAERHEKAGKRTGNTGIAILSLNLSFNR